jgi:hypothetical protein
VKREAEAARGADEDVGATCGVGGGVSAACGTGWSAGATRGVGWGTEAACGTVTGSVYLQ